MTIIQSGRVTVSEQADRNRTALALQTDGTALGVLQGVQSGLVLTKTSGMGWQLDLGRCVIAPATAANGPVVATVTVAETGSFAAGDATRDRIDVVTLQIDETATTGNGLPAVKTAVIQGAYPASGQPVTPTVPAGSIGLWSVRVNAGTSAGGGGWNTALLVDLRPVLQLGQTQHVEIVRLTQTDAPAGSMWGLGAMLALIDTAMSENYASWCTAGASNDCLHLGPGAYQISWKMVNNAGGAVSFWHTVSTDGSSAGAINSSTCGRSPLVAVPSSDPYFAFAHVNVTAAAGQDIFFKFSLGTANSPVSHRIKITKIG